ncbi:MAG: WecB/TagA/CpsF family glycosyltransferase [Chloroflexi bacterium]|nr:WecB/TagA/CpsF family glycosyltransferase [Chloroflexota bacterium]
MASEALVIQDVSSTSPDRAGRRAHSILRRRVNLGGVNIDQVDRDAVLDRIRGFLVAGQLNQIVTVNLDFVSIAERDPYFRDTLNEAELAVADGMPLVWLSRVMSSPLVERITGVELVDDCCRLVKEVRGSVFLLGAAPGVAEIAAERLHARHPGLRVAGVYAPPFGPLTDEENERILARISRACPDVLFVALGAPQQDVWIRRNRDRIGMVSVAMGVGGTLDLLAGRVSRAPVWMQRAGLEWLFRLLQEPRRLWRRYIVDDIPMLLRLTKHAIDAKRARSRWLSASSERGR